jgi:hypothetical protein
LPLAFLTVLLAACQKDPTGGGDVPTTDLDGGATETTRSDSDSSGPEADGEVGEGDRGADTDAGGPPADEIHLAAMREASAEGMTTSVVCSECHSNDPSAKAMRDEKGRGIGYYDLWEASMKANAARDPFWRAMVSAEAAATPAAAGVIEDKCMHCHSPLAERAAHRRGKEVGLELLGGDDEMAHLALDGVSCALCHQTQPDNFGQESSFSGGFLLSNNGEVYGPQPDPFTRPMKRRTGYTPTESRHLRDSGLCATCHTLSTTPLTEEGKPAADHSFPEQTPYLEWQNSSFGDGQGGDDRSCQECHVPTAGKNGTPIATRIARRPAGGDFPPVSERSPVGRHLFIGGNTLVPGMLRDHADTLNPQASTEAFDALIAKVRRQLSEDTASLRFTRVESAAGELVVGLEVTNRTGHKFPTGFPSRRAWLHVRVSDAGGDVLFESGGWDSEGRIVDEAGLPLAAESIGGPIYEHRTEIDAPEQVQVYEAIMEGVDGEKTYRLMRAEEYRKDNRLLPPGWRADFSKIDRVEPVGTAGDADFGAGGDRVTYRIALPSSASRPLEVEAELVYQPISARFAAEMFEIDTRAVRVFRQYWRAADLAPDPVANASKKLQ